MVKTCCVPFCKQESYRGCGISFHSFPTDAKLKQSWLKAIKRNNVPKSAVICSLHFKPEDYITSSLKDRLKPFVVPSVIPTEKNEKDKEVSKFCRVCLAFDVKMYEVHEFQLDKMFESITGIVDVKQENNLFQNLCWECAARLSAASAFRDKALLSDALLQGLLKNGGQLKKKHIETIKHNYSVLNSTLRVEKIYNSVDHYKEVTRKKNIKIDYLDHDKIQASLEQDKKKEELISTKLKNNTTSKLKKNNKASQAKSTKTEVPPPIPVDNENEYYEYEFLEDENIVSGYDNNVNDDRTYIKEDISSNDDDNETNFNDEHSYLKNETNLIDDTNVSMDENYLYNDVTNFNDDSNNFDDDDEEKTYLDIDNYSLNDDDSNFNDDDNPVESIERLEDESDPLITSLHPECSTDNEDSMLDNMDHNSTISTYGMKTNVVLNKNKKIEIEKGTSWSDKNIVDKVKKLLNQSKKLITSMNERGDKITTNFSTARKPKKIPAGIVKKLEYPHIKRERELEIGSTLFTVTLKSHDEQIQEILTHKESKKYKEAPFKCDVCFINICKTQDALLAHKAKHTDAWGTFECLICKIRTKSARNLRQHMADKHTYFYKCNECSFGTMNRASARRHLNFHKGTTYTCPHCDLVFEKSTTYMGHLRLKHLCDFVCEICGYMFLSKHGVHTHKSVKHTREENNMERTGPYCDKCDVTFASNEAYERHLRLSSRHTHENDPNRLRNEYVKKPDKIVEKPYAELDNKTRICEYCNKEFPNIRFYAQHIRRVHPDKSRLQRQANQNRGKYRPKAEQMCEQCGKLFLHNINLQHHMWVHTGEKMYKCDVCPKSYSGKQSLKFHQMTHKGISRSAFCPMCGKKFSNTTNMKKHLFGHTGLKPHNCSICDKKFAWIHELRSHVNHVHLRQPWPKRVRPRRKVPKKTESGPEE